MDFEQSEPQRQLYESKISLLFSKSEKPSLEAFAQHERQGTEDASVVADWGVASPIPSCENLEIIHDVYQLGEFVNVGSS